MSDIDQCAAGTPSTELGRVREELDLMKTAGVIEVATRNPSVWDFVQDREARIADLERQLAERQDQVHRLLAVQAKREVDHERQIAQARDAAASYQAALVEVGIDGSKGPAK